MIGSWEEVDRTWLKHTVSIDDISRFADEKYEITGSVGEQELWNWFWDNWTGVLELYEDGDEVWFYTSSSLEWNSLGGSEGFAVVRNCKVVGIFTFLVS